MGDNNYFVGNSLTNSNVNVGGGTQIINAEKNSDLVQSTKNLVEEINRAKDELGSNYQEILDNVKSVEQHLSQPKPDKSYIQYAKEKIFTALKGVINTTALYNAYHTWSSVVINLLK